MVQLSRNEAQRLIYRGCARLAKAMEIKHIAKDAAQKWEDGALREARDVLAAAANGPLTDLVIPPLPIALLEVQKRLNKSRPMMPSDITSPFTEASRSPWAVWITHETDPEIPPETGLGNPSTFWWIDLEERTPRRKRLPEAVSEYDPSRCKLAGLRILPPPSSKPQQWVLGRNQSLSKQRESNAGKQGSDPAEETDELEIKWRPQSAAKRPRRNELESDQSSAVSERSGKSHWQPSKRYRMDSSSEDGDKYPYVYVPKCDRCRHWGIVCHVAQQGQSACTSCRTKKLRCSAFKGKSRVVRSGRPPGQPAESLINWFRSQGAESKYKREQESTSKASTSHAAQLSEAPIPRWVDKAVGTESQPHKNLGPQETEFLKGLVSLVFEVVQMHQGAPSIPRTVSATGPEGKDGRKGRGK